MLKKINLKNNSKSEDRGELKRLSKTKSIDLKKILRSLEKDTNTSKGCLSQSSSIQSLIGLQESAFNTKRDTKTQILNKVNTFLLLESGTLWKPKSQRFQEKLKTMHLHQAQ